jgi:Tfp pilus assembly protein PilO
MTPPDDYSLRPECKERLEKVEKGVDCAKKLIRDKVSLKLFMWLFAILVGVLLGSYGYTTKVAGKHDELAKEEKVEEVDKRVHEIEVIQGKFVTVLEQINENLKELKADQKALIEKVK